MLKLGNRYLIKYFFPTFATDKQKVEVKSERVTTMGKSISSKRDIKVIYYVDNDDNTKKTLCAVPTDRDMRNKNVIDLIADEIYHTFSGILHFFKEDATELAQNIAHHNYAASREYEFGVEEIPLFEE